MGRSPRRRAVALVAAVLFVALWLWPSPAPATIAEQRARLPPAAECEGEIVAGVWRSHKYYPQFGDWSIFTLFIQRHPDNPEQLVGRITNRNWTGGAADEEPPACEQQFGSDWLVSMDGRGVVRDGNRLTFGGVGRWRLDQVYCRRGPGGYNLDQFSGVIDANIMEFQSVNNDGGRERNEPMVFRRIRCPPQRSAESPTTNDRPPSFYPERMGGCGRS